MGIRDLTGGEIEALVGARHGQAGFEYPPAGLQPYYDWLMRTLHHLGESAAGWLRARRDDANDTTVRIAPGDAVIDGQRIHFEGGAIDLAVHNNDTAYVWLAVDEGEALLDAGADGDGWPAAGHVKLAEVTLADGAVVSIVDRRPAAVQRDAHDAVRYTIALQTQGDTGSPSTVIIELRDAQGDRIARADVLRVRVCDADGYAPATNATIAPAAGSDTITVETLAAGTDLVLQSDEAGTFTITLTNATAETMTLRLGPPPVTTRRATYDATLNVTHE